MPNLILLLICVSATISAKSQNSTLQLRNGAHSTTLLAPSGGNYTLTFPGSAGSNGQALITNGSGTLSWSAIASSIDALSDAKSGGTDFTNSLLLGSEAVAPASGGALRNTGVGLGNTLVTLSSGDDNTAVGFATLASLASGYGVTAVGAYAMTNAIGASRTVAVGYGAGQTVTSGEYSVFVGFEAGKTYLTGGSSVALGYRSLYVATGNHNVGVGLETLYTLNTGTNNVAVGNYAGAKITTGSGNVILGYTAGPTSNVSNSLYIDNTETNAPLIHGDFSTNALTFNANVTTTGGGTYNSASDQDGGQINFQYSNDATKYWTIDEFSHNTDGTEEQLRIFSSASVTSGLCIEADDGHVGIGNSNPAYNLDVTGDLNYSGTLTNTSDARLKRNVQPLVNALDVVLQLRPVIYEKRESLQSNDYTTTQMGFIAQELEKVLPNSVTTAKSEDAVKSVDYISLIPVLTKALQEQQQLIKKQQAEIDELRQMIRN